MVLEHAGLVATTRDGQRRPRAIVAKPLRDLDRWLDAYRRLWEDRFASLDDYLSTISQPKAKSSRRRRSK